MNINNKILNSFLDFQQPESILKNMARYISKNIPSNPMIISRGNDSVEFEYYVSQNTTLMISINAYQTTIYELDLESAGMIRKDKTKHFKHKDLRKTKVSIKNHLQKYIEAICKTSHYTPSKENVIYIDDKHVMTNIYQLSDDHKLKNTLQESSYLGKYALIIINKSKLSDFENEYTQWESHAKEYITSQDELLNNNDELKASDLIYLLAGTDNYSIMEQLFSILWKYNVSIMFKFIDPLLHAINLRYDSFTNLKRFEYNNPNIKSYDTLLAKGKLTLLTYMYYDSSLPLKELFLSENTSNLSFFKELQNELMQKQPSISANNLLLANIELHVLLNFIVDPCVRYHTKHPTSNNIKFPDKTEQKEILKTSLQSFIKNTLNIYNISKSTSVIFLDEGIEISNVKAFKEVHSTKSDQCIGIRVCDMLIGLLGGLLKKVSQLSYEYQSPNLDILLEDLIKTHEHIIIAKKSSSSLIRARKSISPQIYIKWIIEKSLILESFSKQKELINIQELAYFAAYASMNHIINWNPDAESNEIKIQTADIHVPINKEKEYYNLIEQLQTAFVENYNLLKQPRFD